jgi:hypothetical protein
MQFFCPVRALTMLFRFHQVMWYGYFLELLEAAQMLELVFAGQRPANKAWILLLSDSFPYKALMHPSTRLTMRAASAVNCASKESEWVNRHWSQYNEPGIQSAIAPCHGITISLMQYFRKVIEWVGRDLHRSPI